VAHAHGCGTESLETLFYDRYLSRIRPKQGMRGKFIKRNKIKQIIRMVFLGLSP
jgi:hypothetical protein